MSSIKYKKGYKYQLAEEYMCYIGLREDVETPYIALKQGLLTIRAGYAWDGASGPTIDTKSSMRGSLEHDALYQLMRGGQLSRSCQGFADDRLEKVCIEDGMWSTRASLWERMLGRFGTKNTDPMNAKRVFVAP